MDMENGKKRVSVDFTQSAHACLKGYAAKTGGTLAGALNQAIEAFLRLPAGASERLIGYCTDRERILAKSIPEAGQFEAQHQREEKDAYVKLARFLRGEPPQEMPRQKKQRASVDLEQSNFHALCQALGAGRSTGIYINYLISAALDIPQSVKDDLSAFCVSSVRDLGKQAASASDFEKQRLDEEIAGFRRIYACYQGQSLGVEIPDMRKIRLSDGYVRVPRDWIILEDTLVMPEESIRAGVVEVRNGAKYGLPHVVFFSGKRYGESYSEGERSCVINACVEACPDFAKILPLQVEPPTGLGTGPDFYDQARRHLECPYIGLFSIIASDDPIYDPEQDWPYGCLIVRDEKEEDMKKEK